MYSTYFLKILVLICAVCGAQISDVQLQCSSAGCISSDTKITLNCSISFQRSTGWHVDYDNGTICTLNFGANNKAGSIKSCSRADNMADCPALCSAKLLEDDTTIMSSLFLGGITNGTSVTCRLPSNVSLKKSCLLKFTGEPGYILY